MRARWLAPSPATKAQKEPRSHELAHTDRRAPTEPIEPGAAHGEPREGTEEPERHGVEQRQRACAGAHGRRGRRREERARSPQLTQRPLVDSSMRTAARAPSTTPLETTARARSHRHVGFALPVPCCTLPLGLALTAKVRSRSGLGQLPLRLEWQEEGVHVV